MRTIVLTLLGAMAMLLPGCVQDVPEPSADLAEVRIASGTFQLDGEALFLVELTEDKEVVLTSGSMKAFSNSIPLGAALLRESDWNAGGACTALDPVLAAADSAVHGFVAAGRYVVVSMAGMFGGSARISFGDGPPMEAPHSTGSRGSGTSASFPLVSVGQTHMEMVPDAPRLVFAFAHAVPNGPELDVTNHLVVHQGEEFCAYAEDQHLNAERTAGVWFWADAPFSMDTAVDALPVPPESSSGLMYFDWTPNTS